MRKAYHEIFDGRFVPVIWDDQLEQMAKEYVDTCPIPNHSSRAYRENKGENLYRITYTKKPGRNSCTGTSRGKWVDRGWDKDCFVRAMKSFAKERLNKDIPNRGESWVKLDLNKVGHLSQIINQAVTKIGCAANHGCPKVSVRGKYYDQTQVVCNYDKPNVKRGTKAIQNDYYDMFVHMGNARDSSYNVTRIYSKSPRLTSFEMFDNINNGKDQTLRDMDCDDC